MRTESFEAPESSGVHRTESFVDAFWASVRTGAGGGSSRRRISHMTGAGVYLDDADHGLDTVHDVQPPDRVVIGDIITSAIRRGDDAAGPRRSSGQVTSCSSAVLACRAAVSPPGPVCG